MRVVQITDTHVPADARDQTVLEMLCAVETVDPVVNLQIILDDIRASIPPADFVIATATLPTVATRRAIAAYEAYSNRSKCRCTRHPGNHDLADELARHLPGGNVAVVRVRTRRLAVRVRRRRQYRMGRALPGRTAQLDRTMATATATTSCCAFIIRPLPCTRV